MSTLDQITRRARELKRRRERIVAAVVASEGCAADSGVNVPGELMVRVSALAAKAKTSQRRMVAALLAVALDDAEEVIR